MDESKIIRAASTAADATAATSAANVAAAVSTAEPATTTSATQNPTEQIGSNLYSKEQVLD